MNGVPLGVHHRVDVARPAVAGTAARTLGAVGQEDVQPRCPAAPSRWCGRASSSQLTSLTLPVPPHREVHRRVDVEEPDPDAALSGTQNCAARTGMAPRRSALARVGTGPSVKMPKTATVGAADRDRRPWLSGRHACGLYTTQLIRHGEYGGTASHEKVRHSGGPGGGNSPPGPPVCLPQDARGSLRRSGHLRSSSLHASTIFATSPAPSPWSVRGT